MSFEADQVFECSKCQRAYILPTCCDHYQEAEIRKLKDKLERRYLQDQNPLIGALAEKLKASQELNREAVEVVRFYGDVNNYDLGSDTPNACGSWELTVGAGYGVTGDEFIEDGGVVARQFLAKHKDLIGVAE